MIDGFPQLIVGSTANVPITNEVFDSLAPYFPLCQDHANSHDLTLAVFGGRFNGANLAGQTVTLPASSTSYVEADATTGVVSSNTSGYTGGRIALGIAVTNSVGIFSYTQEARSGTGGGGGGGGVSSVGLSLPGIFSVSGSPVTSSGTLSATLATQAAHAVWIGPTSSTAAPTFRALVAGDLPSIGSGMTGILPVANGGTGTATPGIVAGASISVTGTWPNQTVAASSTVGLGVNSQSTSYTLVLGDANGCIYHPSADTTARTWTIPANSSVAFPVGTAITFDNDTGAGTITIAITTDTLVLVGTAGSTGSRTLAAGGQATALKVTSTRWRINGSGLT